MNNKSLWSFENPDNVSEYSLPNHNSKHFIDVDFLNELLYIYEDDIQKGIQHFNNEESQEKIIKGKLSGFIEDSTKEKFEDFLRICFDFENNVILLKLNDSTERSFYYQDLLKLEQTIIDCLNLESVSSEELSNEFEAIMLLHRFEDASDSEKIDFMRDVVELKRALEDVEGYEGMTEYINVLEEKQKLLIEYFKLYLLGKIPKKEVEDLILNLSQNEN